MNMAALMKFEWISEIMTQLSTTGDLRDLMQN